jgi:hypothetical protein
MSGGRLTQVSRSLHADDLAVTVAAALVRLVMLGRRNIGCVVSGLRQRVTGFYLQFLQIVSFRFNASSS